MHFIKDHYIYYCENFVKYKQITIPIEIDFLNDYNLF